MSAGRATDDLYWMWRDCYDGLSVSLCIGRHAGDFNATGETLVFYRGNSLGMRPDADLCESRFIRVVDVNGLSDEGICSLASALFGVPAPPDNWPVLADSGSEGGAP